MLIIRVINIINGLANTRRKVRLKPFRYDLLVAAIKANQHCKAERQSLSVLRSTPVGKHIEPEIAKEAAISLIDCFHRLYPIQNFRQLNPLEAERRKAPVECLKKGGNCEQEIAAYLGPK